MSGFQSWNSAGVLSIDGTQKPAMISSYLGIGGVTDYGYYQITNPFIGEYAMGYLPVNFYPQPSCRWVRLNAGAACFPGADHYMPKEGANKQVISSQADSLIKISRIWADFFPANTSNQPI